MSRLVRVLLLAVSLAAFVWLGILYRDYRIGTSASNRVLHGPRLSSTEFAHEMGRLQDAELLNPESRWELARGKARLSRLQGRRAAGILESLLRREPDNLDALLVLILARRAYNAPVANAEREIRRLDPLGAARATSRST